MWRHYTPKRSDLTKCAQEPDANQARIRGREPRARAKPRARCESGQDFEARATGKSQTRIRPGLAGRIYRQEPDAHQARIRDRQPGARVQREGAERTDGTHARARARRLEKTIPDTQGSGKRNRKNFAALEISFSSFSADFGGPR